MIRVDKRENSRDTFVGLSLRPLLMDSTYKKSGGASARIKVSAVNRERGTTADKSECQHLSSMFYLPLGVAEDDRLRYGKGVVQITQRVELPLLLLHRHKELSVG